MSRSGWVMGLGCTITAATLSAQQPKEDLRIGQLSGDPNYRMEQVRTGGVTRAGEIVIFNGGTLQVRVYSSQGKFIRAFGGRGPGPGLFQGPGYLSVSADEIAVREAQRTQFFDSRGTLLRTITVRPGEPYVSPIAKSLRGWVAAVRRSPAAARPAPGRYFTDSVSVELLDAEGKPIKPLIKYAAQRMVGLPGTASSGTGVDRPLFEGSSRFNIDAGGRMFVTDREAYRIQVYDPLGKPLKVITRPHQPVTITQAHVDSYGKQVRDFFRSQPSLAAAASDEMRRTIDYRVAAPRPKVLPALGSLLTGDDGSIWVERPDLVDDPGVVEFRRTFGTNRAHAPAQTFDRFDAGGCYLGSVKLPPRFLPFQVTRDAVVGMQPDENDAEFIVRYSVAPRTCASRS